MAEAQPDDRVLREFAAPRPCFAIEETLDSAMVLAGAQSVASEQLAVVIAPAEAASEARRIGEIWTDAAQKEERRVVVAAGGRKIEWRRGRAIVLGSVEGSDIALKALADFAFHEGELRALERTLDTIEAQAERDVERALVIRFRHRKHWRRISMLAEECYRMRLRYVRLAPHLAAASPSLPHEAREMVERMLEESDMENRLEAASDRLEALEDLYEGGSDRIADYRWYIEGHWLELAIIALLLIEGAFIAAQVLSR